MRRGAGARSLSLSGQPDGCSERLRQGIGVRDALVIEPLLSGQPFVHVNDLRELDNRFSQAAAERTAARTILWVALRRDDRLLGFIVAARPEVRPFTDKQIALL